MSVALLAAILFFGEVFALSGLSFAAWLVLIVLVLLVVPVQMTLERIFDKCSAFFTARAEKKARRKGAPPGLPQAKTPVRKSQ